MTKYGFSDNNAKIDKATINKIIVEGKVPVQYVIPQTAAESTSALITGENVNSNGTSAYTSAILVEPPYPMSIICNWNASGSADDGDTFLIEGENAHGSTINETLTISSAAAGSVDTNRAFAKIGTITPGFVSPCTDLGFGWKREIGLPYPIDSTSDIISYTYGSAFATTDIGNMTVNGTYDTILLPAMAVSKSISVRYLSKVQE